MLLPPSLVLLLAAAIPTAQATCCDEFITIQTGLVDEIHMALPERELIDPELIVDRERNIAITEDRLGATVKSTFMGEGAGYLNVFGWFVYDPTDLPAGDGYLDRQDYWVDSGTLFENASFTNGGGNSQCCDIGDTQNVVLDPAWEGLSLGFWLKANGVNDPNGKVWSTVDRFNDDEPTEHSVMLRSNINPDAAIMGWEDLRRNASGCDNDFNDLVLLLTTDPANIMSEVQEENNVPSGLEDTDGDGCMDELDSFPADDRYCSDNRYPPGTDLFSVVFEDQYPSLGDADYNDFMGLGRVHEWLNADSQIARIRGEYLVAARGAGWDSAFHTRILGAGPGEWTLDVYDADENLKRHDSGTSLEDDLDLELFPSTHDALVVWNTTPGNTPVPGDRVLFEFVPDTPLAAGIMALAPYDPYLLVEQTGYDVHVMGVEPIPGSTDPLPDGEWFQDENGTPWALILPIRWDFPVESNAIWDSYAQFDTWRYSGGAEAMDWYNGASTNTITLDETFFLPATESP